MSNKIYCIDCMHFEKTQCHPYPPSYRCKLDDRRNYSNPIHIERIYGTEKQLKERNKDNNCVDFKQKESLFKKLKNLFN